jgi:ketosteroid isomerase-like protein
VQQQLFEALARGGVAGALALFTDDAVIDAPSGHDPLASQFDVGHRHF